MALVGRSFCYVLFITINTIEMCCTGSIEKGDLMFTINNIRLLKKTSHTLIAVPGSRLELRCWTTRSGDNVTMSSSHGVSIADHLKNFSSLVIPAMSCADTGSYFCQTNGKSARRVDIAMMIKCPPRLCHRQPSLKQLRANLGENKSIILCVVAANLNDTTFKLNGQRLNLLLRDYHRQDLGHYTFVLQSGHGQKIKFSFFIYCSPPFQTESIVTKYKHGDQRQYRFQFISTENISTTALLDNETLVINNKDQTQDVSLQCRNKLFKYKCTFKQSNATNNMMKLTIKDVSNRSFTLKLQYRRNHRIKTSKRIKKIFFEDEKYLKFKLKIHPDRTLKKLKISGEPVTSNTSSNEASYFILSNKTIVTVVIRNVTLYNECISSSCSARVITQGRQKLYKRNVRLKFIRRDTRKEKQSNNQTQVIFTVNNVSSEGATFQFLTFPDTRTSLNCSGVNASIKHENNLLVHSRKSWTSVVINKTQCKDQGIYYCYSGNTVKTLAMGIKSCPPRLCTPYDNVVTVEHSKLEFKTCVFGATSKRWKVAVVKKLFPISDVNFTYTVNNNTMSTFHRNLTIRFVNRTELDTEVLWLKINEAVVTQIHLPQVSVKDGDIKRHYVLFVMTGLAVLLTLLACCVTWKYFGNTLKSKYTSLRLVDKQLSSKEMSIHPRNYAAVNLSTENTEVLKNNESKAMKSQYENIFPNNIYTSLSFLESLDENNLTQSLNKCIKLNNENTVTFQNNKYQKNTLTSALCQSLTRLKPDIGRGQGKDLKKTRLSNLSLVSRSENITLRDEPSSSNMGGVSETVNAYVHLKGSNKDIREPSYGNDNILDVHQSSSEDDYKQIPDPKELREVKSLGRYVNDDGLIYISLSHDYIGNQYRRKKNAEHNTPAIREDEKVIYSDINWINKCLSAETNLDKST
ncbi:hypothetical protein Bpfe_001223 [Biomphalaria pfeifferi]|uniref:Ig-like domain-containing protein n=1 Tax=Biomphalaria pfeifferi TaxID=112525 RepID=A0AAD8C9T1_BIOPF|nr:hypothetical protein Bpfe_001223 [Biomphalaria pfeifferi]